MKTTSKIFIVIALMCVSAAAAYSQDCNSYLQRATEFRDKGDYCQAKQYYQMYQSCNADADVSTEIAMCVNRLKLQNSGTDCPDYVPENGKNQTSTRKSTRNLSDVTASSNSSVKSVASVGTQGSSSANTQFKVGVNVGAQLPMNSNFKNMYKIGFGGEVNAKYMVNKNIGVGLGVGYYTFDTKDEYLSLLKDAYEDEYEVDIDKMKDNFSIIPIVGKFSYAFGQNAFKPYVGVDLGLYMLRESMSVEKDGKSNSGSDSLNKFGFTPVIGFEYTLTNNLGLDVNAKYHEIFTDGSNGISSLGVNVGIVYSF